MVTQLLFRITSSHKILLRRVSLKNQPTTDISLGQYCVNAFSTPQISVKGEKESQLDLDISGLKSGGSLLDKATIKCIMQKSEKARRVDATREVFVYREVGSQQSNKLIFNFCVETVVNQLGDSRSHVHSYSEGRTISHVVRRGEPQLRPHPAEDGLWPEPERPYQSSALGFPGRNFAQVDVVCRPPDRRRRIQPSLSPP